MKFYISFDFLKNCVFKKVLLAIMVAVVCLAVIFGFSRYNPSLQTSTYITSDESKSVTILMYHSVLKSSAKQNKYVVTPDNFEEDLKYITEHGYNTVLVSDLIDFVYSDKSLPDNPLVITFDDGYYNNYLYAFPLLKKYNCKMVLSPIAKCSEDYSECNEQNAIYTHVTWDEIKEMTASGLVEIANHSYNMHTVSKRKGTNKIRGESTQQYKSILSEDLQKAQGLFTEKAGITPIVFTYPFGAYCDDSKELIKELGFKASLICEERKNTITKGNGESLYNLGRYLRSGGISTAEFFRTKICNS